MRTRVYALLVVVCLLASLGAVAQARGTVTGVVVNQQGAVLPGVTVTIDGPERRSTVTNERGVFVFAGVAPGTYGVQLTLVGFRPVSASITVKASDNPRLQYTMTVDAFAESVAVSAEALRKGVASGVPGGVVGGVTGGVPAAPPPPGSPAQYRARERVVRPYPYPGGESYARVDENPFRSVAQDPLSTFSIDVDTASYANVRRFLTAGTLPPVDAVRIEEMINYFRYPYAGPSSGAPFSVTTELTECPWNPRHRLAMIGLQGRALPDDDLPPRNLVFLIDVSGSMQSADKLPLVRNALRLLADTLTSRDRVAIVVYAGSSGLVLPSTPGDHRGHIHRAIAELEAGGSTNGGQGIQLAYHVARANFVRDGINRVILATDGDFNVGITGRDDLLRLIEHERSSGVFLSVLGVGTGNLKDSTMEMLADTGNGNYAYLDSLQEARKVLINEAGSTLVTIAKDVKLQVEFNPRHVAGYRLIGYENRLLQNEDFNDDKKDAGEIGAGHSVTALYEIVPAGVELPRPSIDPLKYQTPVVPSSQAASNELLTVKLRYKHPAADDSQLISHTVINGVRPMSANAGFASAVAEIGMLLRDSKFVPAASFDAAIARARKYLDTDADGYRLEFVKLAEVAASLKRLQQTMPSSRQ
jgi:Ca-activated chloride channel family protein